MLMITSSPAPDSASSVTSVWRLSNGQVRRRGACRAVLHREGLSAIDDVTREELAELAEAAHDLLGAARMMFWLGGHEDKEDRSFRRFN